MEAMLGTHLGNMDDRTESGYYSGTIATRSVIKYWNPKRPNVIGYCTTAKFNKHETLDPMENMPPDSRLTQGLTQDHEPEISIINEQDNPLMENPIEIVEIILPAKSKALGINISRCSYDNLPYIIRSTKESTYQNFVNRHLRHNAWILVVVNNDPISAE